MTLSPAGIDFLAGTLGGVAQVFAGHPLDTLKVRLQTQNISRSGAATRYHGAWGCFVLTLREEGVRGLFKGVTSPIAGVAAVNAVLFWSYGLSRRYFQKMEHGQLADNSPPPRLTIGQLAACGAFAGLVNCVVINPVELIKARLQVQYQDPAPPRYRGPFHCLVQTISTEGVLGLGRGMYSCIAREVPCYAAYFAAYEYAARKLSPDGDIASLHPVLLFLAGGIGGTAGWVVSYPQDLVKSILQVEEREPRMKERDGGITRVVKGVYAKEGFRGFWKGFGPCIIRSFPANAATILVYNSVKSLLKSLNAE